MERPSIRVHLGSRWVQGLPHPIPNSDDGDVDGSLFVNERDLDLEQSIYSQGASPHLTAR